MVRIRMVIAVGALLFLLSIGALVTYHLRSAPFSGSTLPARRPVAMAVDTMRNRAFVLNSGDDSLSVIDTSAGTLLRTVSLGS
ncbi:MAG TPA: hypothetical protein VHB98_12515, partial [Chloroflexota bacterium]|nr:hypothetical protein [Chloroflexota bacterium]